MMTPSYVQLVTQALVKAGQDVVEIESEKGIRAHEGGVLGQSVAEGQVMPVLSVIGAVE